MQQFILTKQIAVEAETAEEAATKDGKTISLNVNPRPQTNQSTQVGKMGSQITQQLRP